MSDNNNGGSIGLFFGGHVETQYTKHIRSLCMKVPTSKLQKNLMGKVYDILVLGVQDYRLFSMQS